MSLTPGRKSIIAIGVTSVFRTRREFRLRRDAREIGRGVLPGAERTKDAILVGGGDAWILRQTYSELAQLGKTDVEAGAIRGGVVTMAPGIESVNTFKSNSDLPGIGMAPSVVSAGVPAFIKRVPKGGPDDWSTAHLADEAAALPPPDPDAETEQTVPLDRIVSGSVSYPENTPWLVMCRLPSGAVGTDTFLNFYFGGNAPVEPQSATGGHFCLTLRGSGTAILWEKHEQPGEDESDAPEISWKERRRWQFNVEPGTVYNTVVMRITPYGRDRIWFMGSNLPLADGQGFTMLGPLADLASIGITAAKRRFPQSLYVARPGATGHRHVRTATGPGTIALDHRRKPRAHVVVMQGKYCESGEITDGPFAIPEGTPAGTPLTLRLDHYLIPNGAISGAIYDATTHQVLDGDGTDFYTNEGQYHYYVRISMTSDAVQTPVFRGYNVSAPGEFGGVLGAPLISPLWGVQVDGPDLTPDHENGSVALRDFLNEASVLRLDDDLRCRLSIVNRETGAVISHLMDGLTNQVHGKQRGKPHHTAVSPNWQDYDQVRLTGLWPHLTRQFAMDPEDYLRDPNAPIDPETNEQLELPWRITDIIRDVMFKAGTPQDELDIPDLPIRLWAPEAIEEALLQYGMDYACLVIKLAKDYLGRILLRDPNAGPRGMWRLIRNPRPPYTNFLASLFMQRPPGSGGIMPMTANAFGANTALFLEDSFERWTKAPEANEFTVYGIGDSPGGDSGSGLLKRTVRNEADIAKRGVIPFSHGPDPGLTTQGAVDWQARTLLRRAGFPEYWWCGVAALLLVWDLQDPLQTHYRPLRVNDLIYVNGSPALVRSANPHYDESDLVQECYYEGVFL